MVPTWQAACPYLAPGVIMIIFILTFAVAALFALSLIGSIANATRKRY
jgi:hypothetical protein